MQLLVSLDYKTVFSMGERSSSYRGPCFCRVMNRADQLILSIPDDAASKLWGVDKGPTNVMIHIEDGRDFNVFLSASKEKLFFFMDGPMLLNTWV
ncbi:hypothetical protein HanIR_Chr17g0878101 [Helianthus annuus]|nr:hypothetical protein HanIR_Chr17g0878101 [Helianthus annuus]